ncbi:MAG: type II toxin-antitoxin system RelE/ParE family toxin [Bacteroidales bacterium]|nr:type II toxin-antitoxin system RelE/ParE family toxin [Bacteroidales bacterium]
MVRYKIEWSLEAREDLIDILDFYNKRNVSSTYSRKLYINFQKRIKLLSHNPFLGVRTDFETVRVLITDNYQIIYEIFEDFILIILIWDSRRNPEDKMISRRIK